MIGAALARARDAWMEGGCVEGEGERMRLLGVVMTTRGDTNAGSR
jgi:hypothetical protein